MKSPIVHLPSTGGTGPIRVGLMGCSSFALRAMVPAIAECEGLELHAIASRDPMKARGTAETVGGAVSYSYPELISDPGVDVIYMPLPTGVHEEWVHKALDAGKHLLVEKSLACDFESATRMIEHARASGLLILENFLFPRHLQISWVRNKIAEGAIGEFKFFRATFTIPPLDDSNFRYNGPLGGGALLDVGAYMVKSSSAFLGPHIELLSASLENSPRRDVDIRGAANFSNPDGLIAQTVWGFDTHYQCTWEFLGSEGRILCERALTPPPGFEAPVRLERGSEKQDLKLPADNHYVNQWNFFASSVRNPATIPALLDEALFHADMLDRVRQMAEK